ncbi:hypothetical protein GEMRC1_006760 [Eukaryota sp. GEM-RC1]
MSEDIPELLSCSIHFGILHEPVSLSCGHTFCSDCIKQWQSQRSICPFCRSPILNRQFSVNYVIQSLLDQYSATNSVSPTALSTSDITHKNDKIRLLMAELHKQSTEHQELAQKVDNLTTQLNQCNTLLHENNIDIPLINEKSSFDSVILGPYITRVSSREIIKTGGRTNSFSFTRIVCPTNSVTLKPSGSDIESITVAFIHPNVLQMDPNVFEFSFVEGFNFGGHFISRSLDWDRDCCPKLTESDTVTVDIKHGLATFKVSHSEMTRTIEVGEGWVLGVGIYATSCGVEIV